MSNGSSYNAIYPGFATIADVDQPAPSLDSAVNARFTVVFANPRMFRVGRMNGQVLNCPSEREKVSGVLVAELLPRNTLVLSRKNLLWTDCGFHAPAEYVLEYW